MGWRGLHFPDLPVLCVPSMQIFTNFGIICRVMFYDANNWRRFENGLAFNKYLRASLILGQGDS